eukprot:Rmarinus@m.6320
MHESGQVSPPWSRHTHASRFDMEKVDFEVFTGANSDALSTTRFYLTPCKELERVWNSVVQVIVRFGDEEQFGTGFVCLYGGTYYVVTNAHVITDESKDAQAGQEGGQTGSSEGSQGSEAKKRKKTKGNTGNKVGRVGDQTADQTNSIEIVFFNDNSGEPKSISVSRKNVFRRTDETYNPKNDPDYAVIVIGQANGSAFGSPVNTLPKAIADKLTDPFLLEESGRVAGLEGSTERFAMIGHPLGKKKAYSVVTPTKFSDSGLYSYDKEMSRKGSSGSPIVPIIDSDVVGGPNCVMYLHFYSGKAWSISSVMQHLRAQARKGT